MNARQQRAELQAGLRGWEASVPYIPEALDSASFPRAEDRVILHAMILPIRLCLGLLALAASSAAAQTAVQPAADSGMFVIRRAGDTVATERFTRTATSLQGTLAVRNGKGTAQAYKAVIAPDASVPLIEVTVREDADSGRVKGKVVQQARVIFKEDSAAVDDVTGHGLQTRVFGTERGAVPYLNLSFSLLEQVVRRARAASPAGSKVPLFNLGGGQTLDASISPLGADSLGLAIGNVVFHLRVDAAGRVLGGRIAAQQLVVDRVGS
jgi:hypothetical protein